MLINYVITAILLADVFFWLAQRSELKYVLQNFACLVLLYKICCMLNSWIFITIMVIVIKNIF